MKTIILFALLLFVVWNVPQPAFSRRLWYKMVWAIRKRSFAPYRVSPTTKGELWSVLTAADERARSAKNRRGPARKFLIRTPTEQVTASQLDAYQRFDHRIAKDEDGVSPRPSGDPQAECKVDQHE